MAEPLAVNLAYKYVALALMLGEANFFARQANLHLDKPFSLADALPGSHVGPPSTNDLTGSVVTTSYFFGFGQGHLANFKRMDFASASANEIKARNERL